MMLSRPTLRHLGYLLTFLTPCAAALNPDCAPGGNFDLTPWKLELPIGSVGKPDTISSADLEGCDGYENSKYFFTNSGGALVTKVPGSPEKTGCVTTPNSEHCRTELHENTSWDPNSRRNRLFAKVKVYKADDGTHGTCIGQIHQDKSVSIKPVMELYCDATGKLVVGIRKTRDASKQEYKTIGQIDLNAQFTYEIRYEEGKLGISINGEDLQELNTYDLDSPLSYFKAGNYNQGENGSEVHIYALTITH